MANKVPFETLSNYLSLVCILVICLAIGNAMPQEKSFQTENEIIEGVPKLNSYPAHSSMVSVLFCEPSFSNLAFLQFTG